MKGKILLLGVLLITHLSFGQELAKDIRQNWYANLGDSAHIPDAFTLNLYPKDHAALPPHYRLWRYKKSSYDRIDIETRNGIWDPYEFIEQWKVVKSRDEMHLMIKIIRAAGRKKRSRTVFNMTPTYYKGKLVRIVLVKVKGKYS